MTLSTRLTACLCLVVWAAPAQKKPVTVEVAAQPPLSAPAIRDVAWSRDGGSFVYKVGKNLWVFDAANGKRRELGSLEALESAAIKPAKPAPFAWENRRVREQAVQWLPDGASLLLLAEGDLFLWTIETGAWKQLTRTAEAERDPKLSPDGRMVSFCRSNELHVLDLAGGDVRQLTHDSSDTVWNARLDWVYPEELDLGTAHWWSPDSKRIAFLQFDVSREWVYPQTNLLQVEAMAEPQRYPRAGTPNADVHLGIVAAAGGPVTWADLGNARTSLYPRFLWHPSSTFIAVQRLNRVQNELTLLFVDAAKGSAKTVLNERDPYWINIANDMGFVKDGFVWSSETSGFRHLYVHSLEGKKLRQLTKGEWEIKMVVAVTDDAVYYLSRERSPLGVDLHSVPVKGGERKLITPIPGVHSVSVSPGAKFFIDAFGSLDEAPRRTVHRIDGSLVAILQAADPAYAQYEYLRPEIVNVKTSDGALLYARLTRPAGFTAGKKYPAVVLVYGGPHAQGVCECYGGLTYDQVLAQRGFVVWELDNRGTAGRGHAFETKLYRRFGRQELADQQEGIRHLVSLGFVDPARIGMQGWSYGGFLTLYTMVNAPGLIRAGVAGAPVVDWRNYDTIYTERYLGLPEENPDGYRDSSPVHKFGALEGKLMLAHNFSDDNVLFSNTMQAMVALQKAGKLFETAIYPLRSHGVTAESKLHFLRAMTDFFERHLSPEPGPQLAGAPQHPSK